jgi:DNA repair photolyase
MTTLNMARIKRDSRRKSQSNGSPKNVLVLFHARLILGAMSEHTETRTQLHPDSRRGRGAISNASGRYENLSRVFMDDGWGSLENGDRPVRTSLKIDASRTAITRNASPDLGFDQSINPYRGCEHGCAYCYARPTHAWLGLSPGIDFESNLFYKPNAAALLRDELASPRYKCSPIALGTNTDPYQPVERSKRITRQILEVLLECGHPFTITTKSALVCRDLDLLREAASLGLVKVALSVTTLDRSLARAMEPRASTPDKRLAAIRALAAAGVPAAVMVAPIVPALTDWEMERILERASEAGAEGAGYILLRLPLEIKDLFREWLEEHHPDRAGRVVRLVNETRGGKDYDSSFFQRMTGSGPYADLIAMRFNLTCRKLGLDQRDHVLTTAHFRPPGRNGQMALI